MGGEGGAGYARQRSRAWRWAAAETLRPGDVVLCREAVADHPGHMVLAVRARRVERVRRIDGGTLVAYDVDAGPAPRHVRAVGAGVRLVRRADESGRRTSALPLARLLR